jgi:hypothetical protein
LQYGLSQNQTPEIFIIYCGHILWCGPCSVFSKVSVHVSLQMKGRCGLTVLFYLFRPSVYPQFEACTVSDIALPLCASRSVVFLMSGSVEKLSIETATRGGISHQFH